MTMRGWSNSHVSEDAGEQTRGETPERAGPEHPLVEPWRPSATSRLGRSGASTDREDRDQARGEVDE